MQRNIVLSCVLIIVLGLAAYANVLKGEFLWDDTNLIKNNVYIKDFRHLPKLFSKDISSSVEQGSGFYRPLQMLSYMLDYQLSKLNPIGYHLRNLLLHIFAALCLFWLLMLIFQQRILALLAGLLFLLHPVQTEAVAYVSGRSDSLALLFMLLAFIYYLKYLKFKRLLSFLLMLIAYILALLSRETVLILPLLLLIYHYIFRERLKTVPFLSIVAIALAYIVMRVTLLKTILAPAAETSFFQRLPGFFVAVTTYIRILFVPLDLHMEYGDRIFSWADPRVILGLLAFLLALVYILRKRDRRNLYKFSLLWFFTALLPVSNLYPLNAYMAEHWLYVPIIGFCLILAEPLSLLYDKKKARAIFLSAVLLSGYTFLTVVQNDYWRRPISFYRRTLRYAPDSARVYSELGLAYDDLGRRQEAIAAYKKAIAIDPEYDRPYAYLALAYRALDKDKEALSAFKKAIGLNPQKADVHINLGNLYVFLGQYRAALDEYQKAIELNPDIAESHYNSGVAYQAREEYLKAIAAYKRALELDPAYTKAYYNLGSVHYKLKDARTAIKHYQQALELDPYFYQAYFQIGLCYFSLNDYDQALFNLRSALAINPLCEEAYAGMANIYLKRNQRDLAIEYFRKAEGAYNANVAAQEKLQSEQQQ